MTPAGRPKSFDETEALVAAMGVFWAKGFEGASMGELVEAMGIGRQSLYDTFGDKRSLYLRALAHYVERAGAPIFEILSAFDAEPIDRLNTLMDTWRQHHTCPECKGCFLSNTLAACDPNDPEVAAIIDAHHDALTRALESLISQGQQRGQFTARADSADLAALLTSIVHGLSLTGRSSANTDLVPATLRALERILKP